MRKFLLVALLLTLPTGAQAGRPQPAAGEASQVARYHGVLIRVPDLVRARAFYVGTLGFSEQRVSETMVRLIDDSPIYLEQSPGPLRPPEVDEARSAIAFQALDIHATARRLRELGVVFLSDEPIRVGVGLALRFRDPFGNIHALLQQTIGEVAPFEEPEVYNSGFKQPDSDTPALRRMFAGLGFVVRSERYYPPSLPIGHGDGSFAFMLHENEPEEPEVRARSQPESAAVSLIFTAADLAAVQQQVGSGREDAFALGRRMRVTAPSGVPVEFWRLTPDARTRSPTGQVSKPSVRQPTGRHARRRAPGGG